MNNDLRFILLEVGFLNGIMIFNFLIVVSFVLVVVNLVILGVFVRVIRRLEFNDFL